MSNQTNPQTQHPLYEKTLPEMNHLLRKISEELVPWVEGELKLTMKAFEHDPRNGNDVTSKFRLARLLNERIETFLDGARWNLETPVQHFIDDCLTELETSGETKK